MQPGDKHRYVADSLGPPQRRLYISSIWDTNGKCHWEFVVDELRNGAWEPLHDTTDAPFSRILLYPEDYAQKDIVWIDEKTGQPVDIYSLAHE